MPAKEIVTFDKYIKELNEAGYEILDITGLKYAHKRNMGQRLKEEDLNKFTRKKEKTLLNEHPIAQLTTTKQKTAPNVPQNTKKQDKEEKTTPNQAAKEEKKAIKKLIIKENSPTIRKIYNTAAAHKKETTTKEIPSTKREEVTTSSKEENEKFTTLKEQYCTPLQNWVEHDLDENSIPKREIKYEEISQNEVEIKIIPSEIQEERGDSGAHINIKKSEEESTLNADIGPINESPLNYEYFYQLLKTAKENGIETISFDDIKTKEFATGLLAASLMLNLKLENAPKGIDITTQYAKTLPKKVQNKLRIYNQKNKMTIKGKEIKDTTDKIRKSKSQKALRQPSRTSSSVQIIPSQTEYGD